MSARDPPDPDDPIDYYLEELELGGMSSSSVDNYEDGLAYLREFLDENGYEAGELTERHCKQLISKLKDTPALSQTTTKHYAGYIDRFYQFYNTRGTFEVNPMALALQQEDLETDTADMRRDVSVPEMADFLESIAHPLVYTIVFLFAKTGIRVSELCNLDARDLYLDHPGIRREYPSHRPILDGRPQSLYVAADDEMYEGAVVNGEERQATNKRERATVIPIDDELKQVLVYWLAMRPSSNSDATPVFTIPVGKGDTKPGDRLTPGTARYRVVRWSKRYGWWHEGAGVETNVTPHYFRHFFTTHMRTRTQDDAFVKFIRGDTGDDIIDTYTHAWGDTIEETYLENIYKLLR